MDKRLLAKFTTLLTVAMIASFSVGYIFKDYYVHRDPQVTANVYFYEGSGADAKLLAETGNLITDLGENVTLFGLNAANQTLVAISTGNASAITQTLTKLDTEATTSGFDRVIANVSAYWFNSGDISINYTAAFDASATISVNSVGLHWSATDDSNNNMYAASFITDGTQHQFPLSTPASRLTVVWVLTINAN